MARSPAKMKAHVELIWLAMSREWGRLAHCFVTGRLVRAGDIHFMLVMGLFAH